MPSATSVPVGGALVGGAATAEVGSGDQGPNVPADLVVLWDFDNDGDFDESVEDITGQVVDVETQTGRDFPSQLTGRAGPGQLRLTVRNDDDRYSYFNAASPLNADPFSLRVGRKIRLQTADTVDVDPVLLVRDRFDRPNGHPAFAETGHAWALLGAGAVLTMSIVNKRVQSVAAGRHLAAVDVNQNDYYTQVALGPVDQFGDNWAGILARFVDFDNYVFARAIVNKLELVERVAGVDTVLGEYVGATLSFRWWPGFTLGLAVDGTTATVYACGVPVITDTLTGSTGDRTGLIVEREDVGLGNIHEPIRATFDDFYVFDRTATPLDGVLFTGRVTGVRPTSPVGGNKRAVVEAEGTLANAAVSRVVSSRSRGAGTGILVGDALAKAGLLHPPGSIAHGTITTGPVTLDDGKALDLARQFEATEFGFLHESPHGSIDFHDRAHRDGASPVVTFSDQPGAQYQYAEITPLDQRHDIVNRVTAGVAPELPVYFAGLDVTTDSNSTGAGVANHVDVTMPTVEQGDALLVVIASTVSASGIGWHNPIWWGNLREFQGRDEDAIRTRVYFHPCDGSESGTTVRFYTNTGTLGGAWIAKIIRLRSWWEGPQGTSDVSFVAGDNPPFLEHGWGRHPVLFVAINAGLTSVAGGGFNLDTFQFPEGYDSSGTTINGTVNGFDVGLQVSCKLDVAESDNPTPFGGLEGYAILESGTLAVRGFDGDHLLLPTLKNPSQFQATPGRFVTVDDLQSQLDLRVIRSHELAPNLFADETAAQAYGDAVIADFRDDRPIFRIRFPATLSAQHREQAIVRRVGDLIHLVANGDTGMGVSAPFFIEAIGHEVTDAGKRWWVTWELSPA